MGPDKKITNKVEDSKKTSPEVQRSTRAFILVPGLDRLLPK